MTLILILLQLVSTTKRLRTGGDAWPGVGLALGHSSLALPWIHPRGSPPLSSSSSNVWQPTRQNAFDVLLVGMSATAANATPHALLPARNCITRSPFSQAESCSICSTESRAKPMQLPHGTTMRAQHEDSQSSVDSSQSSTRYAVTTRHRFDNGTDSLVCTAEVPVHHRQDNVRACHIHRLLDGGQ